MGEFYLRGVECGEEGCMDALEGCETSYQIQLQTSIEVLQEVVEGGIGVSKVVCGPGYRKRDLESVFY